MSNIKHYRYCCKAEIGELEIKANISCGITATWRRSNEVTSSQKLDLISGKAIFNQQLSLAFNMSYDEKSGLFLQKKSMMSFNLITPSAEKNAGSVLIDIGQILNSKKESAFQKYILQKCPIKGSFVTIKISYQNEGQREVENSSYINSNKQLSSKEVKSVKELLHPKDEQIKRLNSVINQLTEENNSLKKKLATLENIDGKEGIIKSKNIQHKLQDQLNSLQNDHHLYQTQLEKVRIKFQTVYDQLCSNLNRLI